MPGNLKVISLDTGELIYSVKGVPQVLYDGQGGLSDVVLDPKFSENKKIYFSYSAEETEEEIVIEDVDDDNTVGFTYLKLWYIFILFVFIFVIYKLFIKRNLSK